MRQEPFLIVKGELQRKDGVTNLVAQSLKALTVSGELAPVSHNFG